MFLRTHVMSGGNRIFRSSVARSCAVRSKREDRGMSAIPADESTALDLDVETQTAGCSDQRSMPASARQAGLEVFRAVLRRRHPGFDVVFGVAKGDVSWSPGCNPRSMPSTTTQAIATRIPNDLADQVRREAQRSGDTVSAVAARWIRQALDQQHDTKAD